MTGGSIRVLSRLVPILDKPVTGFVVFSDRYGDPNSFLRCDGKLSRWSLVLKSDPEFANYLAALSGIIGDLPKTPGTVTVADDTAGTWRILLQTHKATVLECRRPDNTPVALFSRHFSDDTWIMTSAGDPDWNSELVRLGYREAVNPQPTASGGANE